MKAPTKLQIQKAHGAIDLAKDASWDELYKLLDAEPGLVNVRPDVREFGIIHQAAYHGDDEALEVLIDKYGADAQLLSKSGELPIDVANGRQHAHIVTKLHLRQAAASDPVASCAITPEKEANKQGCVSVDGAPPAKQPKVSKVAKKPLKAPTKVQIQKAHAAIDLAKEGSWDALYEALDSEPGLVNIRPDVREYAVLHQACFHGDEDAINTLIDKYGADPKLASKSGELAIEVAQVHGHSQIVDNLKSRQPAPLCSASSTLTPEKVQKKDAGAIASASAPVKPTLALTKMQLQRAHSAIDLAKDAAWDELCELLDAEPALVNIRPDVREYAILHQVAYHGAAEIASTLVEKYGADAELLTKSNKTAAVVAQEHGHAKLALQLKGASPLGTCKPVEQTSSITPIPDITPEVIKEAHQMLDLAKEAQWEELYSFLDARPRLINVRPAVREYGALHQAVHQGSVEVVKKLMGKYGADPALQTKSGEDAMCVAKAQGHSLVAMGLAAGAGSGAGAGAGAGADDSEGASDDLDFVQMPDGSWKVVQK